MRILFLLLSIALCGAAQAQTNVVPSAAKKAPPAPTEINSDTADFDLNARLAVYRGNVVVIDPQMKLKCDKLVVYIPPSGERLNHIEAQTNVVIDFADSHGQTTHAIADLAVYRYLMQNGATNETVTLTGNPQVENTQGTLTGDQINWDRANGRLTATNPHMKSKQNFEGGTNAAPLKLF